MSRVGFKGALAQFPMGDRRAWLRFRQPTSEVIAHHLDDVIPALAEVEAAVTAGQWAVGMVSFDAGPAFDGHIASRRNVATPLVAFGIFEEPTEEPGLKDAPYWLGPRTPVTSQQHFEDGVRAVKEFIAAGDTYQVNLTLRLLSRFAGDPEGLFSVLARAQKGQYQSFLDLDRYAVCSASPELFFTRRGRQLLSKPMKGTRPAGTPHVELLESEKDRAENTMIVDMMRNDFGRVAEVGTVKVPVIHEIEDYPTVIQMTSTVTAATDVSFVELMKATFPPASITGAPKVSTCKIISELENEPRGVYTGAIGVLAPATPTSAATTEFNVAIRTVWVDRDQGTAFYGVGGGIVWDSDPTDEWNETRTKSRVLLKADQRFQLLESLLYTPEGGMWLLGRHMDRLAASAAYFEFKVDIDAIKAALLGFESADPHKIRLLVNRKGEFELGSGALGEGDPEPMEVPLDPVPVDSGNPFLAHKTTQRAAYQASTSRFPYAGDVLLQNERAELTETSRGNLVVEIDGELLTPAAHCGLLPGTFRADLLDKGTIAEAILTPSDLDRASKVWMINSVRGWVPIAVSLGGD